METWVTRAELSGRRFRTSARTKSDLSEVPARNTYFGRVTFGILPPLVDFDERWRIVEVDGLVRTWEVVGIGREGRKDWKITVKA